MSFLLGPLSALTTLLVVTAACSGFAGRDAAAPTVEIRMHTPGDGPDGAAGTTAAHSASDWRALDPASLC